MKSGISKNVWIPCWNRISPVSYTHLDVYKRQDFEGFDYFGIWSSLADAPLICLEPWTGTATQESEDDVFEHKQGMRMLAPGEKAEYAFTVTVY